MLAKYHHADFARASGASRPSNSATTSSRLWNFARGVPSSPLPIRISLTAPLQVSPEGHANHSTTDEVPTAVSIWGTRTIDTERSQFSVPLTINHTNTPPHTHQF